MSRSPAPPGAGGPNGVVIEIVDALEASGLARDAYQLHDYVDPDALAQLTHSIKGEFTVTFTVETTHVHVTHEGVTTESIESSRNETSTE